MFSTGSYGSFARWTTQASQRHRPRAAQNLFHLAPVAPESLQFTLAGMRTGWRHFICALHKELLP